MAKISARGDRELKRYKHPEGMVLVVTVRGRCLRKMDGGGYSLLGARLSPGASFADFERKADEFAAARGYEAA